MFGAVRLNCDSEYQAGVPYIEVISRWIALRIAISTA